MPCLQPAGVGRFSLGARYARAAGSEASPTVGTAPHVLPWHLGAHPTWTHSMGDPTCWGARACVPMPRAPVGAPAVTCCLPLPGAFRMPRGQNLESQKLLDSTGSFLAGQIGHTLQAQLGLGCPKNPTMWPIPEQPSVCWHTTKQVPRPLGSQVSSWASSGSQVRGTLAQPVLGWHCAQARPRAHMSLLIAQAGASSPGDICGYRPCPYSALASQAPPRGSARRRTQESQDSASAWALVPGDAHALCPQQQEAPKHEAGQGHA